MCVSQLESPLSLIFPIYESTPAHENDIQIEGLYVLHVLQMIPELSCNAGSTVQKRVCETQTVLL